MEVGEGVSNSFGGGEPRRMTKKVISFSGKNKVNPGGNPGYAYWGHRARVRSEVCVTQPPPLPQIAETAKFCYCKGLFGLRLHNVVSEI